MVDLWLPGVEKHDVGNHGAMEGGPARATWHTTSNPNDHTFKNEKGWFTGGGAGVAPHLLWDPFTGEIAQFFPADSRALALKNADGVRTNRTGRYNIQIEIVFTANEVVGGKVYKTVADTPRKNLDKIVSWLRSLGIEDHFPGGEITGLHRDTVSLKTWLEESGHYGHNQVPGNDHVDPGPLGPLFSVPKPKPAVKLAAFPGDKYFFYGRTSKLVTELGKALVRAGYRGYRIGPGPVFGPGDRKAIKWFQQHVSALAGDADGHLGPLTWKLLKVRKP